MGRLGVTDIAPHLQLDPENISQFRERRTIVRDVNSRLLNRAIPTLQKRIDDTSVELANMVDGQSALIKEEIGATTEDVAAGLLSRSALEGLTGVAKALQIKRNSYLYKRGVEIIEARRTQQVESQAPVEPAATEIPTEPETPPDLFEKEKQIARIRESLGNPEAFNFPEGMTIDNLFDDESHMRIPNVLKRAQITTVKDLLSLSAKQLSKVNHSGDRTLELIVEKLQQKGILPKEEIPAESAVETEQAKIPLVIDTNEKTVTIGQGQAIKLSARQYMLLSYIYNPKHSEEKIPVSVLGDLLKGMGERGTQKDVVNAVSVLERNLGQRIFERRAKSRTAGWAAMERYEATFVPIEKKPAEEEVSRVEAEPARVPLVIDPNEQTVTIGQNPAVKLGKLELALIGYIYHPGHLNEEIPTKVLQEQLNKAGSNPQHAVGHTVFYLEKKLGRQIFKRIGRTKNAKWAALEQFEVEIIESAEPQLTAKQRREEAMKQPVPDSRLLALTAFLDDLNIDREEIRKVLGPGKNNRPLTYWNGVRALVNAVIFLKGRTYRNLANEQEVEIWEQFRKVMNQDPKDEVKRFYDLVRSWYDEQKIKKVDDAVVGVAEDEAETVTVQEEKDLAGAAEASDIRMEAPDIPDWDEFMGEPRDLERREPQVERNIEAIVGEIMSREFGNWDIIQVQRLILDNSDGNGKSLETAYDIINQAREQGIISRRRAHTFSELDVVTLIYKIRCERAGIEVGDLIEDVRKVAKNKIDQYIHGQRIPSRRKRSDQNESNSGRKPTSFYVD